MGHPLDDAKCIICGGKAVIQWPLVDGEPAFCKDHASIEHTEPYGLWPKKRDKSNGEKKNDHKR